MEEVWKDINLDSIHDQSSKEGLSSLSLNPHNLQDTTFLDSPVPPPATVLSLNSGPSLSAFNFIDNSYPLRPNSRLQTRSNPILYPSYSDEKMVLEPDSGCGDRRHKRMIKNRESAARSRARRQAYINELELEVAQLMEENARLKRQRKQLYAGDSAQIATKRTHQRTLTAPF